MSLVTVERKFEMNSLHAFFVFPIQTYFMAEVPGWGFTLFYLSSAVGYVAYATLVKVCRRAEHESAPTVTSIGIIIFK